MSIRRLGSHPILPFGASDIAVGATSDGGGSHHGSSGLRCAITRHNHHLMVAGPPSRGMVAGGSIICPRASGMSVRTVRQEQTTQTDNGPSGASRAAPSQLRAESGNTGVCGFESTERLFDAWPSFLGADRRIRRHSGAGTAPGQGPGPGPGRRMRLGGSQRHRQWPSNTRTCESPTGLQGQYRWTPSKRIFSSVIQPSSRECRDWQ